MLKVTRMPHCLLGLAMIFAVAGGPAARADVVLRWKFTPGETLRYVIEQNVVQKLEMGATPITMTMTSTAEMSWEIGRVDADGVASITQTITRMRMKMESPQGIMLDYDSASGKEPEGMAAMLGSFFDAMVNQPISMKADPRGKVSDVKVPQAMIDGFTKMPGMEKMGGMFSEETMAQMSGVGELPEAAVSPGDTWTEEKEISFPMLGKMKVKATSKYLGSETRDGRPLEKIAVTQQMDITPGAEQPEFTMKIKESKTSGTTYFDSVAGRFAEAQVEAKMKFEVTMGEKTVESDMDMKMQMGLAPAGSSEKPKAKQ